MILYLLRQPTASERRTAPEVGVILSQIANQGFAWLRLEQHTATTANFLHTER